MPVIPVDRPFAVFGAFIGTAVDDGFGRALDEDVTVALAVLIQGGHEPVSGFEGNGREPVFQIALDIGFDAGFHAQCQKRAFRRVAHHRPAAVLFLEDGVVAKDGGMDRVFQFGITVRLDHVMVQIKFAGRKITRSGHFKSPVRRDDGLDGHFVFGECPGLVGTDDGDRTQGFDGRQLSYDGV